MPSSPELTSPMSIFEMATEQISGMNESASAVSINSNSSGSGGMGEFMTISPETTSTLMATNESTMAPPPDRKLHVAYTVSESVVSLLAIFGNALVVYIFCKNRSLRRYRNYYIVALAIADFLVGLLGIPFAILASVGLPRNLYGCLFTVSILMVLCTISIFCLVAVSIDRYWATTNPFAYYRNMTTTTAVSIILFCWVAGGIIGFLPLFGWYNRKGWERDPPEYCYFTNVMDYSYLVFLYFATIVFPALLMIGFYGYIYHVVLIKIRQKGTFAPQHLRRFSEQSRTGSLNCENRSATQVLRIMVSEKRREAKAAKKLGIIVLFFMLCWMPLYTINCIQAFYPNFSVPIELLNFTIILSHANSALNPFLYAYHLKEFRLAMKHALLSLLGKICCGLVSVHVDTEYPMGPMSRSLTMPSVGHLTTIPNPHHNHTTGGGGGSKVSIKFRQLGNDCRSAQISSSAAVASQSGPNSKNLNNSTRMIPVGINGNSNGAGVRGNLLRTGKSLTSLSLTGGSNSQLIGIPLQQQMSKTAANGRRINSPKLNNSNGGGGGLQKYNNNGATMLYNQLSLPQLVMTAETTLDGNEDGDRNMVANHSSFEDEHKNKCPVNTANTNAGAAVLRKSESFPTLPDQLEENRTPKATSTTISPARTTTPPPPPPKVGNDDEKEVKTHVELESCNDDNEDDDYIDVDDKGDNEIDEIAKNHCINDTHEIIEIPNESGSTEMDKCGPHEQLSPPQSPPKSSSSSPQMTGERSLLNSHSLQSNQQPQLDSTDEDVPAESSQNNTGNQNPTPPNSEQLITETVAIIKSHPVPSKNILPEKQQPGTHRVSLDG